MESLAPEEKRQETSDKSSSASFEQPTISSETLVDLIRHELERRGSLNDRERARQDDPILKAQDEEIERGKRPEISEWKKIDLMSPEEILAEDEAYEKEYSDLWEDYDSLPIERETTKNAYRWAFANFPSICQTLGWYRNDDLILDEMILTRYRDTIMEALFAVEPNELGKIGRAIGQSRAAFEYSRLPRLVSILVRLENRRNMGFECNDGVCSDLRLFDPDEILATLMELGRALRMSRPRSIDQIGMQGLLDRCYKRRILCQPNADDTERIEYQFHLIYDCLDALEFTARFDEVRSAPLCLTFYLKYRNEPVHKIFQMVESHQLLMKGLKTFKELPLKESSSPTFTPDTFTVQNLQDFGGLNIEWTDCLDEHLKIFTGRNAVRIFAHPTFLYNCQDLHERDYIEPNYTELSQTYALLFKPSSKLGLRKLKRIVSCESLSFLGSNIEMEKPLIYPPRWFNLRFGKETDIDPTKSPAKRILENFYRCSLPPTIQAAFNISNPSSSILDIGSFDQNKVSTTSMREIDRLAPYYPEDIRFMMTSVFEHQFNPTEAFLRFEYFGPRLRRLKTYLDDRQPQNLRQLWFDRRDARSWWLLRGSIFLSMIFLVLSVTQVALGVMIVRNQS